MKRTTRIRQLKRQPLIHDARFEEVHTGPLYINDTTEKLIRTKLPYFIKRPDAEYFTVDVSGKPKTTTLGYLRQVQKQRYNRLIDKVTSKYLNSDVGTKIKGYLKNNFSNKSMKKSKKKRNMKRNVKRNNKSIKRKRV